MHPTHDHVGVLGSQTDFVLRANHRHAGSLELAQLLLDVVEQEHGRERVVEDGEEWLALVPFWAVWPFETMLVPKRRVSSLVELDEHDALPLPEKHLSVDDRDRHGRLAHQQLADVCRLLDGVICVGGGMVPLVEALGGDAGLVWRSPDDSLLAELDRLLRPGDTLLVKGSNRVFWSRDFVAKIQAALTS